MSPRGRLVSPRRPVLLGLVFDEFNKLRVCAIPNSLPDRHWYRQRKEGSNILFHSSHLDQPAAFHQKPPDMEVNKNEF